VSTPELQQALARLDEITRRLRRECPWDREQDERSIVPHTVEEAYELADAAHAGDDRKLVDELGDVLFQVYFLAVLLEERGAGDLAAIADHCAEKLIRRHPHVFGEASAQDAQEVLERWDAIKRGEAGRDTSLFGEVPENLPALLRARKLQRRAAESGFDHANADAAFGSLREELLELEQVIDAVGPARPPGAVSAGETANPEAFHELGDVLFAAVSVARKLSLDPELALRAASDRFRRRVQAASARAEQHGETWSQLTPDRQLEHYQEARP